MANRYMVGQGVTVKGTYTNAATGAFVDPDDACVDILDPMGDLTTYKYTDTKTLVTKASTGIYTFNVDTTDSDGRWQYRWWSPPGMSGVQTADSGEFFVEPFPTPTP